MNKFRKFLDKILEALVALTFLSMIVITTWQVFTRYALKNPSPWSEELVSFLFSWMVFIGATVVISERGHMNIPMLVEKLSPKMQKVVSIFSELCIFFFSLAVLVYGGIKMTKLTMGQLTATLHVPIGFFYFLVPICGVISLIYCVMNIYDISKGNIKLVKEEEV